MACNVTQSLQIEVEYQISRGWCYDLWVTDAARTSQSSWLKLKFVIDKKELRRMEICLRVSSGTLMDAALSALC